jgi:hypothetical protein
LLNTTTSQNVLRAYKSLPLDTVELNIDLGTITTRTTIDFKIIELIRILYFTNGTYDAKILAGLNSIPYWINKADTVRNFWSENHMIMWMSSDWLLHEKYGRPIDATLDARLRHYLMLKNTYGFYEFFSSTYSPYALSGLLNLADFAQDSQIRDLAAKAAQSLLNEFMLLTTDKGVFFPTAGRNYVGKYEIAYGQNHNDLIYLLTGIGPMPPLASSSGAFLASSALSIDSVQNSWRSNVDTLLNIGHSLDSGFVINQGMSPVDKVVFQWSSGAYFHPKVIDQTGRLLNDSMLWNHVDFELLRPISTLPPSTYLDLSEGLGVISKSSVISGEQVSVFKHNSVSLSSIRDFWKGKVGFQQFPCVATIGTTSVYTASGQVKRNWLLRNSNNANIHLPYVFQKKNVALMMYRPEPTPDIIGNAFTYKDVALHWVDQDFDETATDSLWILGRQENGYVAVKRACIGTIDSVMACNTFGGQTWVTIVGDSAMYGSFANFKNVVHQSHFSEKWYLDTVAMQYVYYAKIDIDTISIDYAWGVDSILPNGIHAIAENNLALYPNPANEKVIISLDNSGQESVVELYGVNGQLVKSTSSSSEILPLDTRHLPSGMYIVIVKVGNQPPKQKKILVSH